MFFTIYLVCLIIVVIIAYLFLREYKTAWLSRLEKYLLDFLYGRKRLAANDDEFFGGEGSASEGHEPESEEETVEPDLDEDVEVNEREYEAPEVELSEMEAPEAEVAEVELPEIEPVEVEQHMHQHLHAEHHHEEEPEEEDESEQVESEIDVEPDEKSHLEVEGDELEQDGVNESESGALFKEFDSVFAKEAQKEKGKFEIHVVSSAKKKQQVKARQDSDDGEQSVMRKSKVDVARDMEKALEKQKETVKAQPKRQQDEGFVDEAPEVDEEPDEEEML
ncbi:MAG: hypothetical protein KAS93_03665 [Gammaproteobacteria bacterium]|nr:hypothetical protein [Gammaproteobacteria bacterium]